MYMKCLSHPRWQVIVPGTVCVIDLRRGVLKVDNQKIMMNKPERAGCSRIVMVEESRIKGEEIVQGRIESSLVENADIDVVDVVEACGSSKVEDGLVIPSVVVQDLSGDGHLNVANVEDNEVDTS